MAVTITARGNGSTNTGGQTTLVGTMASTAADDQMVFLLAAYDNSGTVGADPYSSITDTHGNTWTPIVNILNDPGAADAGVVVRAWYTLQNVSNLVSGNTVTVTFSATTVARCWQLYEALSDEPGKTALVHATTNTGSSTASTAVSVAITQASTLTGDGTQVIVAFMGAEHGGTTVTDDADTSGGSWSTGVLNQVGTTTAGMTLNSQYKTPNARVSQTFNNTLGTASDWAAAEFILYDYHTEDDNSLAFADRAMESSTTTGTGTYTLAGAVTGYQALSAVGTSRTTDYCAWEVSGGVPTGGWEVGQGVYSAGTLTRASILASSNSGAAVNWSAGTRYVACVAPAARLQFPKVYVLSSNLIYNQWTKPTGCTLIGAYGVGAGASGQAGAVGASGGVREGGDGGGGGGATGLDFVAANDYPSTAFAYRVGLGGEGVSGSGTASTNGGDTSFNGIALGSGGTGPAGGTGTNTGGAGGVAAGANAPDGSTATLRAAGGGGAGGGLTAGNVAVAGGAGGARAPHYDGGGAGASGAINTAGTAGGSVPNSTALGGAGGGGGGSSVAATGGNGGAGGAPGGGGGGGGAAVTGQTSGNGAAGADGRIVVVCL